MNLKKTIANIKRLKIQGAENVALASIHAISYILRTSKARSSESLLDELNSAKKKLISTRPTEPAMRNCLNFICNITAKEELVTTILELNKRIKFAENHIKTAMDVIAEIGARKIKNGMQIYTHCHSSTVIAILKKAKQQGKKFTVHNTETRPMLQGRTTAEELAKLRIPVVHYIDSAARIAIKKCDLMLIGADAITTDKIFNKIGSELFTEVAHRYDIPIYVCTDSWKFDNESVYGKEEIIEERPYEEVWKNPPRGVKVSNMAFEKIEPTIITGIISELGIYKHNVFTEELRRKYYWMF